MTVKSMRLEQAGRLLSAEAESFTRLLRHLEVDQDRVFVTVSNVTQGGW